MPSGKNVESCGTAIIRRRKVERSIVRSETSSMVSSPVHGRSGSKRRNRRRMREDLPLLKVTVSFKH